MNLAELSNLELDHQEKMLFTEFDYWRNNSNPGTAYAKHRSQIKSITEAVSGFLNGLPDRIPKDDEPFEQSSIRANGLLYANHMWAFFRTKFALRLVDGKTGYSLKKALDCADEFAWNCYEPARAFAQQAGELPPDELKEPPLTFFASDAGPYMAQRNALFSAEGIIGHSQDFERFNTALEQLPVPIIGVPWVQSNHLPASVVIAHEVGHLIERDFSASDAFIKGIMTVEGICDKRRSHWCNWASEMFADTYAVLCTGPAYLTALIDYLVAPKRIVTYETLEEESARKYPTRSLRIAFNLAVLKLLGLPDEGIGQLWYDAYPHSSLPQYAEFCEDAKFIAGVFLDTPLAKFGAKPITVVMNMTQAVWEEIKQKAKALVPSSGKPPVIEIDANDGMRFRSWFAAATWAYHTNPTSFIDNYAQRVLLNELSSSIPPEITRGPSEKGKVEATPASIQRAWQNLLDNFMQSAKT